MPNHKPFNSMTIIENDFVTATFVEGEYVLVSYKTYPPSKEFQAFWTEILSFAQGKKIDKWIFDVRKIGVISPNDQKWIAEKFFVMGNEEQIAKFAAAFIVAKQVFAELSAKNIVNEFNEMDDSDKNRAEEAAYFEDFDSALSWVKTQ